MTTFKSGILVAAALSCVITLSNEASAIEPISEGTLMLSAERMVSSNFSFYPGGMDWDNQIFGAPGNVPLGAPRLGLDYFIVNGLSLGAHIGTGLYVDQGDSTWGYVAVLPRIGYAFSLGSVIDFWPRLSAGFLHARNNTTGVISIEAMFLANLDDRFAIEFGPALDVPLSSTWGPDAIVGANAGFVVRF